MKTKISQVFQTCRMFIDTDRNQACKPIRDVPTLPFHHRRGKSAGHLISESVMMADRVRSCMELYESSVAVHLITPFKMTAPDRPPFPFCASPLKTHGAPSSHIPVRAVQDPPFCF
jgi:hypothetical protein